LTVPVMAIGKLLPRAFTATPTLRIGRPDIRFPESLATSAD
jgi:hypothetical protein